MDDLDAALARIDAALAEGEPDPFPWTDAARWSPSLDAGTEGQWELDMDPCLAVWYRRWDPDPADPPWVIAPATAEDMRNDWD